MFSISIEREFKLVLQENWFAHLSYLYILSVSLFYWFKLNQLSVICLYQFSVMTAVMEFWSQVVFFRKLIYYWIYKFLRDPFEIYVWFFFLYEFVILWLIYIWGVNMKLVKIWCWIGVFLDGLMSVWEFWRASLFEFHVWVGSCILMDWQ